ncbi:hypothetical protein CCHR01_05463 [Colletotrichum chrysophilum]|uniref:Uncharacterized protein n=1 Tax=Colletotrichum chrysophilum TaxID=1836956 RepID=A0AAD9EKN9_9PEZI|nr:hypothetical protein CCHR01_05463 [Colletotrichum chrysophilum]
MLKWDMVDMDPGLDWTRSPLSLSSCVCEALAQQQQRQTDAKQRQVVVFVHTPVHTPAASTRRKFDWSLVPDMFLAHGVLSASRRPAKVSLPLSGLIWPVITQGLGRPTRDPALTNWVCRLPKVGLSGTVGSHLPLCCAVWRESLQRQLPWPGTAPAPAMAWCGVLVVRRPV